MVLNNQPQGGFLNRARSPDALVARREVEDDNGFFGSGWFGSGWGTPQRTTRPRSGRNYYPQQQPRGWW